MKTNTKSGVNSLSTRLRIRLASPPLALPVALLLGGMMLASAIEQAPGKHYQAARAALAKGKRDRAEREVKLALQDNPLDAKSHFLLGCLLAAKGDRDQAIVGFERALALDSANPEAQFNLGTLLLQRGEAVPAALQLESTVSTRPDYVPAYNNLAKAYFLAGLPELALAAYEEALRRDPSNAIALKNRERLAAAGANQIRAAAPVAQPVAPPAPVIPALPAATAEDPEADALREVIHDLPHVTVERRAGYLTLCGWTSDPKERAMLDKILGRPSPVPGATAPAPVGKPSQAPGTTAPAPVGKTSKVPATPAPAPVGKPSEVPSPTATVPVGMWSEVLDLTSDDTGDPKHMLEVDAVIFILSHLNNTQVGFNFLQQINMNFKYVANSANAAASGAAGAFSLPPHGWIFTAAANYAVNIANADNLRVAVLARPHLTTLSGTTAKFLAGGELVFQVTGNIGGNVYPYPFGTTLDITPTLLREVAEDGTPRVHVAVEAGRLSVLALLNTVSNVPTVFDKVSVTSEAVLNLGQTLILSGLNQRESRTEVSGIPGLMYVPLLKYLVSTKSTVVSDSAVIILLTPRDPAFWDEQNAKATAAFVEKRRAFVQARRGTPEDMRRFRERYPDWMQLPPNRFASHVFLMENSELYRAVSTEDLTTEDLDLELLGPEPNRKPAPRK